LIKKVIKKSFLLTYLYVTCQKIIIAVIKGSINYDLHIPRKNSKHPAYRYISIPLSDIWDAPIGFYEPLDKIGAFKLTAARGIRQEAVVELVKLFDQKEKESFWAIKHLSVSGITAGTGKEDLIIDKCYHILSKAGVEKLYALVSEEKKAADYIFYEYIKLAKAKLIKKYGDKILYRMKKPRKNKFWHCFAV